MHGDEAPLSADSLRSAFELDTIITDDSPTRLAAAIDSSSGLSRQSIQGQYYRDAYVEESENVG
jgi:hypothetical protein